MRRWLAKLLRWLQLLRFEFQSRVRPTFPDSTMLKPGEVVVVEDAGVRKWACLLCPGGCGANIALSLNPSRRPRWRIVLDFWRRPTIEPSVHQTNACGCHFFIKEGRVEWCSGGRPKSSEMKQSRESGS